MQIKSIGFIDGKEINRNVGFMDEDSLIEFIGEE